MKSVVFADGPVGERVVGYLLEEFASDLVCIVTTEENRIYELARGFGVACMVWDEVAVQEVVRQTEPDIGFLVWWPKIIRQPLLGMLGLGFVNTHPSLLPHNRGKHFSFWAIVEEAPFGVSLHFVDEGIDTGDIVAQVEIPVCWEDTGETLYRRALDEMVSLFRSTYPDLREGRYSRTPQDLGAGSFHWGRELTKASVIDLEEKVTAKALINRLRARTFEGFPGCRFDSEGKTYEIRIHIQEVT